MSKPIGDVVARPTTQTAQQQQPGYLSIILKNAPLMLLAYFASSWLSSSFLNPSSAVGSKTAQNPAKVEAEYLTVPIWPIGTPLDIQVRLSTSSDIYSDENPHGLPHHSFSDIRFGDWNWTQIWESDFEVPKSVQNNGTLWAVITVSKKNAQIDPRKPGYNPLDVYRKQKLLTRYLPKRNIRKTKNLLGGSENITSLEGDEKDDDLTAPSIISYYHPNLTIGVVSDSNVMPLNRLPPVVQAHVNIPPTREKDPVTGNYYRYPVVFPNDFWIMKESLVPVNDTITSLHLRVEVNPMSHWKFQLLASMTVAFDQQASKSGGAAELDEIKRMFIETAPWLLITTFLVSALHAVFEFLAFSSDVSHWRNKKELVGVSLRTILSNIFVQVVVLLYLLDNSEGTSWIILLGQGTGVLIEAWKITKAVDIKVVSHGQGNIRYLPWIKVTDKHVLTEDEKKTQEYDALAFRWVSYVTGPSLLGYTIYSLLYNEHRGWYSFTISTLSSFVYAFGFIELVPQLVINYKLKSVAHMPMKAMMYKTLNTVVDDFFAFCIKMPILHRLACFRDDVVFVILLYQYWIYKIDYSRVNEFGQPGSDDKKPVEDIPSPSTSTSANDSKQISLSEKKNQ
ncbi:hypothetical protein Pst134EA_027109 [Puccinia striiformis f. sp. tritici]|uniref:Cleft lip and palate associated transmembrane protein n=1 Tax=Puccinia striiformis f. sp. tritici PST-78 TaxID=1165861 RepID=A0A0L0VSL8_9BASI|nr:hypothetical protein Pst134EA_027109 [Puccinia striiformis f. sp. tritici]KAH9450407.1 hypothetical protein Pst134EA_027109 [Puccinia striiformis f. sp. tritici]KNF02266.1 hypothetical protein PSTG_04475 [Puccinia striiformis f. sp. tritici PST-78]